MSPLSMLLLCLLSLLMLLLPHPFFSRFLPLWVS
jgi:hypothetical protein